MNHISEKRNTSRYSHQTPILCSYFNHPEKRVAVTVNSSDEGMFFLSDEVFSPGAMIQICTPGSVIVNKEKQLTVRLPFTSLAEVKWCRKSMDGRTRYEIGVGYLPVNLWGQP
ncbi:MAG: hypothetical protein WA151_09780 [Desulfatirhabdiaceae bacterium]